MVEGLPTGVKWPVNARPPVFRSTRKAAMVSCSRLPALIGGDVVSVGCGTGFSAGKMYAIFFARIQSSR
jgi:hypothetical protein